MRPAAIVDSHVHMFPERLFLAVRKALTHAMGWRYQHGTDPDTLAAFLEGNGVERFFLLNYAHKPGMSAELNRWNSEVARRLPAAIPFAAVHPRDDRLLDIAKQAVDGLGLAGFKLHLDVIGIGPDDASLMPLYRFSAAAGRPMVVHSGTGGSIKVKGDLLNADRLRRVLTEFPDLRVCVPHLGARDTTSFFDLALECPNLWFDTAVALTREGACFTPVDRERLAQLSHRVMFGSDFPNLGHSWEQEVQAVLDLGLDEGVLQQVLHDNALEFVRPSS